MGDLGNRVGGLGFKVEKVRKVGLEVGRRREVRGF